MTSVKEPSRELGPRRRSRPPRPAGVATPHRDGVFIPGSREGVNEHHQKQAAAAQAGPRSSSSPAFVALAAASTVTALAVSWPTAAQEIASTGVQNGISFCGTKPITLGIEDGFGINAWSQESYAAVRSEAAKCKNVKQIVLAGGGRAQTR